MFEITSEHNSPEENVNNYASTYLQQYWPQEPTDAVAWADNAVLMLAYQEAALAVLEKRGGIPGRLLDISTGPALAPLLAMISCVSEAQLSDYHERNRIALQSMAISYWRNYVPMLVKLYADPVKTLDLILARLNSLRLGHTPLEIDLLRENIFSLPVDFDTFDLVSMNFVADGITSNENDYLRCLGRVTDIIPRNAHFIMSSVVDCDHWLMGDQKMPSPNVSERTILDFLESQGLNVIYLSRSMRHFGLTYSGGWIVLAAEKK